MEKNKKRSLILAGGGVKVALQAGVMQVLLDEANLKFDHIDAASGGTFNLAMYCQNMTGADIANKWRNFKPIIGVDLNWREYGKLFYAESLFTMEKYRENVFPYWGLDWQKINSSKINGTFNVYNFSKHELEVIPPQNMTEDYLVACVALPMWFPPVKIQNQTYIDSVFITDANIEEAIRQGADEIWVIWTVSEQSVWNNGFVANYFQIIETSANGHFRRILKRIEENNAHIKKGIHGEFGRHIDVKILRREVSLHYLINFSTDRFAEAVNEGVVYAREWCKEHGIKLISQEDPQSPIEIPENDKKPAILSFTEEMKGYIYLGENDYDEGYKKGRKADKEKNYIKFRATINIEDLDLFITTPEHEAKITGYVKCRAISEEELNITKGIFNLFVHKDNPQSKRMLYHLVIKDSNGNTWTLSGHKVVENDDTFDLWSDTTTLFVKIFEGEISSANEPEQGIASGIMRIEPLDFFKQITTFNVDASNFKDETSAYFRFGKLFFGKLWDVYFQKFLHYGPF